MFVAVPTWFTVRGEPLVSPLFGAFCVSLENAAACFMHDMKKSGQTAVSEFGGLDDRRPLLDPLLGGNPAGSDTRL